MSNSFCPVPKPIKAEKKKTKYIKKVSNHKIIVTEETYNKTYARDLGKCRLCGANNIELHHIIYRSEDKSKINDVNNCIMLCVQCHDIVHSNKHYWQPKLKEMLK